MDYDHEMVLKSKDWVKRHQLDNKLPNFNTGRILVSESQVVNESLKPTKASNDPESSKNSESESLTPLPPLKNLQRASPNSAVLSLTYQDHSPRRMLRDLGIPIILRPLTLQISMIGFPKNSDDETDERTSEEYLKDLEL
nr:hypothetical protein [Tanacetum cinerariifolium]